MRCRTPSETNSGRQSHRSLYSIITCSGLGDISETAVTTDSAPPDVPPMGAPKRQAPWLGRKRTDIPRNKILTLRLTAHDHARFLHGAEAAGLSVSAYGRRLLTGTAGPPTFKRPAPDRRELARLLGLAGNIASNNNQMAHYCHLHRATPALAKLTSQEHLLAELVTAVKRALSRGYLTILIKRLDRMIIALERIAERSHSPNDLAAFAGIRDEIAQVRQTILTEIRHHG
jgi:hypothetical protein